MVKVYLYPNILVDNMRSKNPYISNLSKSISAHNQVINEESPSESGVFDILKYLSRVDVVYLNWIEDLPNKRGGRIQSFFFILLLAYLKLAGKRIVWTLHNKKSHSAKHAFTKSILLRLLLRKSDLIITHASDGLNYIPDQTPKKFIPHPVDTLVKRPGKTALKDYDIIIWGTVNKYKGIDLFLNYLKENGLIEKYRIVVAGTVVGADLLENLEAIANTYPNVTLLNRYIEQSELSELIEKSKLILFCYQSESVLSSGALMDSLLFDSSIAGPDVGAFHDLAQEGIIYSFSDYKDLISKINRLFEAENVHETQAKKKEEFLKNNSWEVFSIRINELLKQL